MKKLILALALAVSASAFDFKLTFDDPGFIPAQFDTNITRWASIDSINVYRSTNAINFVLLTNIPYVTNLITLSNQPSEEAFYVIKFVNISGESGPSNTNHVYPPSAAPLVKNVKGH